MSEIIILENQKIKAVLCKNRPVILEYIYKPTGGTLLGDLPDTEPVLDVIKGMYYIWPNYLKLSYNVLCSTGEVCYRVETTYTKNAPEKALSFDLAFRIEEDGISIEFKNVVEYADFHLMNVQMPRLVTVKENGEAAKLVIPAEGGRIVDITRSSLRNFKFQIDWLNPMLAGAVFNNKAIGIIETDSFENAVTAGVFEKVEVRYGYLTISFIHRLRDYDMVEYGFKIPASGPEYHLKVQDSCKAYVSVIGDWDGDGEVSWVDAAKYIRSKIPFVNNPYYADKLRAGIFNDMPYDQDEIITFKESLEQIRKIAFMTDYQPTLYSMVGWQYDGHDTGFPSIDKVNERCGTFEELREMMEEAKKVNAIVGLHDNYEDAFKDSPAWDPDVISQDARGDFMRNGNFMGGQAYLTSTVKYVHKHGIQRVRDTMERYKLHGSNYIDVLSGAFKGGRRYDFNPNSPMATKQSVEAKALIIEEFRKYGVDITTEDFSNVLIGHVTQFAHLIYRDNVYFRNEENIPLVPFIYHRTASFGLGTENKTAVLRCLIYGGKGGVGRTGSYGKRVSMAYLVSLPWMKFFFKHMDSYSKTGSVERVTYDDGSYVEVDFESNTYSIVMEGRLIGKDFTCFVPMPDGKYLAYSLDGGELTYPAPEMADAGCIKVLKLNDDGTSEEVSFRLEGGNMKFEAQACAPYKVICG